MHKYIYAHAHFDDLELDLDFDFENVCKALSLLFFPVGEHASCADAELSPQHIISKQINEGLSQFAHLFDSVHCPWKCTPSTTH